MRQLALFTLLVALVSGFADSTLAQEAAADPAEDATSGSSPAFESRFRWGVTGGFGPMVGDFSGFGGGLDARFGMQVSPLLGVYAQPALLFGVGAYADVDGAEATAAGLYGLGVLGDVTLGDIFYVAAGPELLLGSFGSASATSQNGGSASAQVSDGPFFSIASRAGFVFGTKQPDKRSGFSLGIDMHMIFAGDNMVILPLVFLGYERF